MHELTSAARGAARPLIEALPSSIYALSIVDDRAHGRVFVDDVSHPTVALVWETTGNVFISSEITAKGLPAAEIVRGIQDLINNDFIPEARRGKSRPMCWIAYAPQSWGTQLPSMLKDLTPVSDKRMCYRAEGPDDEAIALLTKLAKAPKGCEVRPVDREVLESGVANVDELRSEALKMWGTVDRFLSEGFGYCVTSEGAITSWSLSECPSGKRTSVGVETVEAYQCKGHGTAAAASTLLKCRRGGLVADWDCYVSNVPSQKLAEKLGLTKVVEYPVRFFWFNRVDNMLINGNMALKRGRPEDAAEWFDKAFDEASLQDQLKGSWLLTSPERRSWWTNVAADAYEQAGMPGMAKEMREKAAREKA